MTPTISPPTDNLYKFIALFGLSIFLFSLYKSGDAFDAVTKSKIEIEDLKLEINSSFAYMTGGGTGKISDTASVNVVPVMIRRLSNDLTSIADTVEKSGLEGIEKEELLTKVRKMQVQNDNLRIKTNEFLITLFLGLVLIVVGFILWYRKDQVIKDKILKLELHKAVSPPRKDSVDKDDTY